MEPPCDQPRGHRGAHHFPVEFPDEAIAAPPGTGSGPPGPPTVIPDCAGQEFPYQPALFGELFNEEEAEP